MRTLDTPYAETATDQQALSASRSLLGPVMAYIAITVGFAALGAYLGRDLNGAAGLLLLIAVFGAIIGLQVSAARGRDGLALTLLFAIGLALGLAIVPVIADYANGNPSAVWQAGGATALVCGLRSRGRRWARQRPGLTKGSSEVASTGASSVSSTPRIRPRWMGQTIAAWPTAVSPNGHGVMSIRWPPRSRFSSG